MNGKKRILGVKHEHSEAAYNMLEKYDVKRYHKVTTDTSLRFHKEYREIRSSIRREESYLEWDHSEQIIGLGFINHTRERFDYLIRISWRV